MDKLFDFFPKELQEIVVSSHLQEKKDKKIEKIHKKQIDRVDYAFPRLKKLPLVNERNVYSALTHFNSVKNATEAERVEAYQKIVKTAESYKICTIEFIRQYESKNSNNN